MRRAVLLACGILVALTAHSAPASAAAVKNPAQMVISTKEETHQCARCGEGGTPTEYTSCSYANFVQFPHVSGAKTYKVAVRDNLLNVTRPYEGPPFNDNVDGFKTPAGVHWFGGLTGGGGPPPCPSDPYEGGRFEIVSSTVSFGKGARIIGTVSRADGGNVAGVRVSARGPRSASARTDAAGSFNMKVRKGRYTVSAPGYCVKRRGRAGDCDRSANVSVGNGAEQVDFRAPFRPDFSAKQIRSGDGPAVDVDFAGKGWDPEGGPITIRWSGRPKWTHLFSPDPGSRAEDLLRTTPATLRIPAAREFGGRLVSEVWPRHPSMTSDNPCSGKITATQDGASVSRTVTSDQLRGVILWSERDPDFEREDAFCNGELQGEPGQPQGPLTVTPGLLVTFDVYHTAFGFFTPRSRVPFIVGPNSKACAEGRRDPDGCVVRVICLNKPGRRDVSIYWDQGTFKRRQTFDFAWVTDKPCREGEGGLVVTV